MSPSDALDITCRCSQVRLAALKPPISTIRCYCHSCRKAGTALAQLPGATLVLSSDGGVDYALFRKDRVRCVTGDSLLAEHRLKAASPTRRVVATCCNTPMFLDFTRGHWLSVYRGTLQTTQQPPVHLGVMARERESPPNQGSPERSHSGFPPGLVVKMMLAWAAMGFRRPGVEYVAKRLEM